MEHLGLETFEKFPSLSKRAQSKLIWLEIELKARHPIGEELSASRLKRWKGLSGTEVRAMVHRLRVNGKPIGSNSKGYFFAHTSEELKTTYKHLEQRISSIEEVRNCLYKIMADMNIKNFQLGIFSKNH